MTRRYEPRRNHARLFRNWRKRETWQSDFVGTMVLEDGRIYVVGVRIGITWSGKEFVSVYLRPKVATLRGRTRVWLP